jgi:hypothetical protein
MYGESGYERRDADAYWTPEWCVDVLLRHFEPFGSIWEPACGIGNICRAIERNGYQVAAATDLHDWGYGESGVDFLKQTRQRGFAIVTNPPYHISDEFVTKSCNLMEDMGGQVAMLLRNEWDCAASRSKILQRLSLKLVLHKRPKWSDDDRASPRHNFAWFVWNFYSPTPAQIKWDRP